MYKLTIIAGPSRGTSYAVQKGENSIGRQSGNAVVLPSAKVSKKHCVLIVSNGGLLLKDQGSANGTFVNGELTKSRKVQVGDRISVGDCVLEISEPVENQLPMVPAIAELQHGVQLENNVIQFPGGNRGIPQGAAPLGAEIDLNSQDEPPKDLKGKLEWYFEYRIMPFFYGLNQTYEWKVIAVGLMGAMVLANLLIAVYPLTQAGRAATVREVAKRARYMAREIAERNAPMLAARAETKTEIGAALNAEGVRTAVITDLDLRIIAPALRLNQYLVSGKEAAQAIKARNRFRSGQETGMISESGSIVVAVEPIKVLNAAAARNVVAGMAIVSIDASLAIGDFGKLGILFSEALILTGIFGGLLFLVLYRSTVRPIEALADGMDKALKGETTQVALDHKFQELEPLWNMINTALQRASSGSESGQSEQIVPVEDFAGIARMMSTGGRLAVILLDPERKVHFLSEKFEELSGVRADNAFGQDVSVVARDQALGSLFADLLDRAGSGGSEPVSDEFEFSGVMYRVSALAVVNGSSGMGSIRCYLITAELAGGGAQA